MLFPVLRGGPTFGRVSARSLRLAVALPQRARAATAVAGAGGAAALLSGSVAACSGPDRRELHGECVVVCEAICREGEAMDSPTCSFKLLGGSTVEVVKSADVSDKRGTTRRRLCVKSGDNTGWVSEVAGQGIRLITKAAPPSATPTATIRMYTTQRCPWCTRAKELLAAKGWSAPLVEELDPSTDEEAFRAMQKETGKNTVPQIFVVWSSGEKPLHIGGYDVLAAWCVGSSSPSMRCAAHAGRCEALLPAAPGAATGSPLQR
jgi:glutaredoxin 3